MHEMKTLTLNGETFDSFVDQTARQKADEAVRTVNGKNPDENGNIEIKVNAADAAEVAALVARAETAATDAEADAKSARTAATEANNAKGSAMQSASTASAKAILAQTHAGTATEKATAAEESATNASASATRAETAATSADAAATRATEAAERAENASSNSGGNVDQEQITAAVNEALAEAKASGEFDGADGKDGVDGKDGYTPIKGVDYFDGQPGKDGEDGKDGYTPVKGVDYFDGNPGKDGVDGKNGADGYTPVKGKDYFDGEPGEDGITPHIGSNGNWFIGDTDTGKSSRGADGQPGQDGSPGKDGSNGQPGTDGVSPTVSVSKSGKVTTITITDKDGPKTATINDGADGKDGTGGDGYTIPAYWQTALDEGVEAINTALCEAGYNKSAFLFYSDAHWNYGSQMAPTLLKYLYNHTGIARTFFGGDIVNNEGDGYDTMKYLWDWKKQIKDLPNHHSVVGNHDDCSKTNNLFSEQYVYGYLLAAEETPDIVRGESGLYYYVDSPAEKTRYLFLDTAYKGVGSDQQEFVKNALNETPAGWHIVAVSHKWHDVNYDTNAIEGMTADAQTLLNLFDSYNARSGEFADCGAWVEFCIGGHTHIDHDSTSTSGIPVILVETDSQHVRSGLGFTLGTTTESSVNAIIADYDAHKIHVVRIGRGESRDVDITNYVVSYTNLIPTAVDIDGVTIYNGEGYKENIRQSGSSGEFRDNTGSCCTGYIKTPVNQAFTVYLKNIVNNTNDNYGCVFNFFSAVHTATTNGVSYQNLESYGFSPVYDDEGNVIQITVTADKAAGYMVISAVTIDDTSIITINEPID